MRKSMIAYSVLAGSLLLVGCGGGGGEEDEASNDRTSRITYISLNNADIREGSENGELEVQVSLTERAGSPVTIDYETRDGTAVAGEDYQSKSGSLTIPEGDSRGSFTIPIIGDEIHEPDETFEVVLSDPSNARLNSSDAVGTVTIENDDTPPAITFDSRKQSVSEDVGTTRILATLSEESGFAISATLAVSGTALAGGDYTLDTPVTLEFAPGDLEASVDVEILQDNIPEGGETINVEFGELDYASLPDRDGNTEHSIIILGDTTLSDTGLSTYSDGIAADLTVEPSSHPDQDASFGRDAEFEPDFDGHEGFSFTKLDRDGNPLPSNAPEWSCTQDNVTGKVWENKQAATNLTNTDPDTGETTFVTIGVEEFRAKNFRYAWRVDDPENNGGSVGHAESREQQLDSTTPTSNNCAYGEDSSRRDRLFCNSKSYVTEMNSLGTCGFQNWRMPTIEELRSVANYDTQDNSAIPDPRFFSGIETGIRYWSATPAADNEGAAWCFDYDAGEVKLCQKRPDQYRGFMAVRNPQ